MKRKLLVIVSLLLAAIIISAIIISGYLQRVYEFDLNIYADIIEKFPSEKVLGPVTSAKEAKEKAEAVWLEVYGDEVKKEKPYSVAYDENTGTWLVQGHLPWYMVGGVANILIQESDGSVLAVWHEK